MNGTANELSKAIAADADVTFADGLFNFVIPSQWGGSITVEMGIENLRQALPQALAWAGYTDQADADQIKDYLNGLIAGAEASENQHPRGEIIARRERDEFSTGFLGTGAGARTVHEVLVRIAEDFEDWADDIIVNRQAGDEAWYRWTAPANYGRI